MQPKLNLSQRISEHLKANSPEKFTARQLATWIVTSFPQACQAKRERSRSIRNDDDLLQQISAEIGAHYPSVQKRDPALKTTEGRPRKYYYSELSDEAEIEAAESAEMASPRRKEGTPLPEPAASSLREHELYPLLAQYLYSELALRVMRIDERRASSRRGPNGNRWLYPDIVALEDLGAGWQPEIRECVEEHRAQRSRLWSFEVKRLINNANVRECFFQTLSNSSWANFGYLVAAEVGGRDAMIELRMLAAAHGIGFIQLDTDNPVESQILIPARERESVDWNLANRIASENTDFLNYVRLVWKFHRNRGDTSPRDWNLCPTQT